MSSLAVPLLLCILLFASAWLTKRWLRVAIVGAGLTGMIMMFWAVFYTQATIATMHRHTLQMVQLLIQRGRAEAVSDAVHAYQATYEETGSDKRATYAMYHSLRRSLDTSEEQEAN